MSGAEIYSTLDKIWGQGRGDREKETQGKLGGNLETQETRETVQTLR